MCEPKKLEWCHYVCEAGHHGRISILESGTMYGGLAFTFSRKGVEFPHKGKNAVLWLVRDGQAIAIAERTNAKASALTGPNVEGILETTETEEGIFVRWDAEGLRTDDGFEVAAPGIIVETGPKPGTILVGKAELAVTPAEPMRDAVLGLT